MRALTKKHPINAIELCFTGPSEKRKEAISIMETLGFVDTSSIPWREAFPEVDDAALPGISLRAARRREGISQERLSDISEIPQRHISEMEDGKRPIGKEIAKRLAKALNTNYKVFL
jgi:hypothetical protein